ncbi:MAG: glycosyltransferase, partial [Kiritimatiellae bacterium]|nr:glycosyltransferase [Kiritimatiellia bacterium]
INPDVVIQPAQTGLALTVALYALRHRKKSACLITSDSAFTNQGAKFGLDRLGFALGLRLCDAILALNDFQEQSARAIRWRRARVVAQVGTACDMPPGVEAGGREHVLWVGRCIPVKEPTVFAELARRVPEAAFVMVMPPQDDGLFRAVQSAAEGVGNLKIVPGVPRRDVHAYFSKARFLVNTSVCEGFPTTFVEAAAWACPVVSLRLDPNGFLEKAGAGEVCGGDMDRLVETTRRFWNDPELCARVGRTAREYVERDNEPRRVAAQYVEAFQRLPA